MKIDPDFNLPEFVQELEVRFPPISFYVFRFLFCFWGEGAVPQNARLGLIVADNFLLAFFALQSRQPVKSPVLSSLFLGVPNPYDYQGIPARR